MAARAAEFLRSVIVPPAILMAWFGPPVFDQPLPEVVGSGQCRVIRCTPFGECNVSALLHHQPPSPVTFADDALRALAARLRQSPRRRIMPIATPPYRTLSPAASRTRRDSGPTQSHAAWSLRPVASAYE